MLKRALILGLLALGLSGGLQAQQSGQDAAAARALGKQEFAEVVRIYASTDTAQLDDRALYRLAIAEFRLGNQSLAASYLDRALRLNPKGSFASSPERLIAWQKDIGPAAPESTPVAEVVSAAAAPTASAPAKEPESPVSTAPVAVEPKAASATGEIEGMFADAGAYVKRSAADVDLKVLPRWMAIWLAMLAMGFLVWLPLKYWRSGAPARQERNLHRKLFERLQEFRVEAGQIHGAVQEAGRTDSDLHAALSVLLKALDGEIGRSCYFGNGREDLLVQADAETLEVIKRLRPGPMKLSSATGAQVKALFQTSQRAI